jgi:hypothetical protein
VWKAIGEASAAAGSTIPAAFGSRVPNVANQKYQMTSETQSVWTLFIAPVVLRRRFKLPKFYDHFINLVRLLNLCLQFEISSEDIDLIESGFISWVQKYER